MNRDHEATRRTAQAGVFALIRGGSSTHGWMKLR
jgi:hypothetical protein